MKSLAELNALRDKMKGSLNVRNESEDKIKIVVGMATCGIAAGARPVLMAMTEEITAKGITNAAVSQTGCIGICQYEPVVEVTEPGKEKVTYVKMNADKAREVIQKHIIGGAVVTEYTVGAIAK